LSLPLIPRHFNAHEEKVEAIKRVVKHRQFSIKWWHLPQKRFLLEGRNIKIF